MIKAYTPVYCLVAFGLWTLILLTLMLLQRTFLVLVRGKRANQMGMSGQPAAAGTSGGDRSVPLRDDSGSGSGRPKEDEETQANSVWKRMERVHGNCVENLPIFAAFVLAGMVAGPDCSESSAFRGAAIAYMIGRAVQSAAHLWSVSELFVQIRFTGMLTQVVCALVMMAKAVMVMRDNENAASAGGSGN